MTTTLQDLKPAQLKPHDHNPRQDVGNVDELAASIAEQGVIEPLIVAPDPASKTATPRFRLLAGHRRLKAAVQAGLKTVPCIVREDLTDPARQLEAMLVENLQRTDLTPIEEAAAYQQLLEFPGYTIKRITQATGRSAATVRSRMQLAKLSDDTRARIQSRQISLADAQVLAEFADDPVALSKLEDDLGSHNWEWRVERAREQRKRDKELVRKTAALRKAGVRVLTQAELNKMWEDEEARAAETETEEDAPYFVLGDIRVKAVDHTGCPGHAAVVGGDELGDRDYDGDDEDVVYLCTDPSKHPVAPRTPTPTGPAGPTSTDLARQAEREHLAKLTEDLATAAKVRRAHLRSVVQNPDPKLALTLARASMKERVRTHYAKDAIADILLTIRGNDEALGERLADKLSTLDLVQLTLLDEILNAITTDRRLEHPSAWPAIGNQWDVRDSAPWRKALVDVFGYEWSDIEAQLNTEPAPEVVDVDLPADEAAS